MIDETDVSIRRLSQEIRTLRKDIDSIISMFSTVVDAKDLVLSEKRLKALIDSVSSSVGMVNEKVRMVVTPEDTRFYLSVSEVAEFRSNFMKLKAMISAVESLSENIAAYVTTLDKK